MRKSFACLSLLAAAIAAAAVTSGGFAQQNAIPVLNGTVGPGFTITLKQNGKAVKTLKAGPYRFVISDQATIHSFKLEGPKGLAKDLTTVPFVGTKSKTLSLKAGSYKFYCPPHESSMFGNFTVT
jgi:plastocyanin